MKRSLIILLVSFIVVSMAIFGISCKDGAAVEEAGSEEVAEDNGEDAADVEEKTEEDTEVVAQEGFWIHLANIGQEADAFHATRNSGSMQAGEELDIEVTIMNSGGDVAKQIDSFEVALSQGVDAMGVNINDAESYDAPIQKALDQGVPVIAFSGDDPEGAAGNPRLAFIGQDYYSAGLVVGNELVKYLSEGDHVACPAEIPGMSYATGRYAGVKEILDANGITSEIIDVGYESASSVISKLNAYLEGHPETTHVCPMGAMVADLSVTAIEEMGLADRVTNGGFDYSQTVYNEIKAGKTIFGLDQQPFTQGYMTVVQLYLIANYSQQPFDMNKGFAIIVDENNVSDYDAVYSN